MAFDYISFNIKQEPAVEFEDFDSLSHLNDFPSEESTSGIKPIVASKQLDFNSDIIKSKPIKHDIEDKTQIWPEKSKYLNIFGS